MNTSNAKMSEPVLKLKNIVFFVFLMLTTFSPTILLHAQWVEQNSGVSTDLRDIFFVDSLYGWAVGDSGVIINTTNGGDKWTRQNSNIDSVRLQKIFFVNRNFGYIVGDKGVILSTKDGGRTWKIYMIGSSHDLIGVSCNRDLMGSSFDAQYAWAVGGGFTIGQPPTGVIFQTSDFGENWVKMLEIDAPPSPQLFTSVTFLNVDIGWACASLGFEPVNSTRIYKTTDRGITWHQISEVPFGMYQIIAASKDTLWGGGNLFAKSSDGGINWEFSDAALGYTYIALSNAKTGWMITASLKEKNRIRFTEDYWETWVELLDTIPTKIITRCLANIGSEYLWLAGDNGQILKYKKTVTNVNMNETASIQKDYLMQNYPNPFNPSTIIRFSIPKRSFISLCVYDLLGREVVMLVNEERSAGTYETVFNGINLSNGVYFYQLRSGEFVQTRKFVLQK